MVTMRIFVEHRGGYKTFKGNTKEAVYKRILQYLNIKVHLVPKKKARRK